MPNHCETDLMIHGLSARVRKCLDEYFTVDGELDCDKVIPYPQEFKEQDVVARKWSEENPNGKWSDKPKDGFNSGGYEWCVNNWGTKWGTYDGHGVTVSKNGQTAHLSFQSAWSPPIPVMDTLAEMFPDLTFTVNSYECGMGYKVRAKWIEGVKVVDVTSKYRGSRGG